MILNFTDEDRVNFNSLKQVAVDEDTELDDDRPESRVQITEIDTTKIVGVLSTCMQSC